jgi:hypothetical protein
MADAIRHVGVSEVTYVHGTIGVRRREQPLRKAAYCCRKLLGETSKAILDALPG